MNKYKMILLITFLIILFSFNRVNAVINSNDFPLIGKVIYLDAGHGGKDPGAIYDNVKEKDITLIITKKLAYELESNGAVVLLTREGDYDLSDIGTKTRKRSDLNKRASLINESNSHLYLSIHLNAYSSTKWRGLQIFYDDINKNNYLLAKILTDTLKTNLSNVREIKNNNEYYMYHQIKVPGVLIETGFITNDSDRYLLKQEEYQNKLVKLIVNGVKNYFNN